MAAATAAATTDTSAAVIVDTAAAAAAVATRTGMFFCFVSFGHLDGSLDVSGFVQMGRVEDCQDAVVAPCFESFGTNVLAQLL